MIKYSIRFWTERCWIVSTTNLETNKNMVADKLTQEKSYTIFNVPTCFCWSMADPDMVIIILFYNPSSFVFRVLPQNGAAIFQISFLSNISNVRVCVLLWWTDVLIVNRTLWLVTMLKHLKQNSKFFLEIERIKKKTTSNQTICNTARSKCNTNYIHKAKCSKSFPFDMCLPVFSLSLPFSLEKHNLSPFC